MAEVIARGRRFVVEQELDRLRIRRISAEDGDVPLEMEGDRDGTTREEAGPSPPNNGREDADEVLARAEFIARFLASRELGPLMSSWKVVRALERLWNLRFSCQGVERLQVHEVLGDLGSEQG